MGGSTSSGSSAARKDPDRGDGISPSPRHVGETIPAMPRSVLIVDDHAPFRAQARALLEAEGFTVAGEAPDGAAAIESVRRSRPDVVLLDVQLPGPDGFVVAERLAAETDPP